MRLPAPLVSVAVVAALSIGCSSRDGAADRIIDANATTSSTRGPATTAPVAGDTASTTTTTSPPPTTLPPLGAGQRELWVYRLDPGDCFDERRKGDAEGEARTIVKVDCSSPHQNEVFAQIEYEAAADATYPGNPVLTDMADKYCIDAFEGFVGISYVLSIWEMTVEVPNLDTWINGDRNLSCILYAPEGAKLTGSKKASGE